MSLRLIAASLMLATASLTSLQASDVVKANNATALNLPGSWVGGVVPGAADTAVWNDTVTANRSQAIGGNLDWLGIRIANPGGSLMTIGSTPSSTLSLRGGGIDMSAATVDLTIGAQLNLTHAQTWNVTSGRTLTTSSSSLTSGTAALALTGGGTVALGSALLGSGTLDLSNITLRGADTNGRNLANDITLSGNIGIGGTALHAGITLAGDIAVGNAARTITLQSSINNPTLGEIVLTLGTAVDPQVISGGSGGSLALANGNASGTVLVRLGASSGVVQTSMQVPFSLGERVIAVMSKPFFDGVPVNVDGRLRIANGASGSVSPVVTGLTGSVSGAVDSGRGSGAGTSLLTINGGLGTGTFDFSGTIENGAFGFVAITKSGSTTQIFSGNNTYSGQTIVSGGSLLLNGTLVQPANTAGGFGNATTGRVRVENGGVFGGSGRINATLDTNTNANNLIYVAPGGTIAPGASIGTLTIDGANFTRTGGNDRLLNMVSGAGFNFELSGSGGTPDRIDFWNYAAGDLVLNNNVVNLSLLGPLTAGTYTVNIFRFFSDSGTTLMTPGVTSGLALGTLGPDIDSAEIVYDSAAGLISVQYVVVPEPGTVALVGGLATLVLVALRRRFS